MQINDLPQITRTERIDVFHLIALAVLCALVFFYALGSLPMIGPDEPRYSQIAREMYVSGDWVTPRLGEIKWFEKPALTFWLSAAGYALFGENEFAARFGIALMAAFGVLMIYFFGRRTRSSQFGYLAGAVLATCGLWPGFARGATFDLPLAVAVEMALLSFFLWESREEREGRDRLWWIFCFALGLASLAKGLVGIVLPVAIIAPYLVLTRRQGAVFKPRLLLIGAAICLAVAAVWYAPVVARNGSEFIDEFFVGHHFQRYFSNKYRHPQPFYFFFFVAIAGSFPWSFFLMANAWRSIRNWREALDDRLRLFLWLWVIVPILFFSFSGSKLPGYILPVFPALALIVGDELERWWSGKSHSKTAGILTGALIVAAGVASYFITQRDLGTNSGDATTMAAITVVIAAVFLGLLLARGGRTAALYLPFGGALIVVAAAHLIFPGLGNRESLRELSLDAVQLARPAERLVFFVNNDHGINFYATGLPLRDHNSEPVTVTSTDEIALLVEASRSRSILVASRKRWVEGVTKADKLRSEIIAEQNYKARCSPDCDWVLLRARKK